MPYLKGLLARAEPQTGLFTHNLYLLNISILNALSNNYIEMLPLI